MQTAISDRIFGKQLSVFRASFFAIQCYFRISSISRFFLIHFSGIVYKSVFAEIMCQLLRTFKEKLGNCGLGRRVLGKVYSKQVKLPLSGKFCLALSSRVVRRIRTPQGSFYGIPKINFKFAINGIWIKPNKLKAIFFFQFVLFCIIDFYPKL